jgi:hypothetical protein
MPAGIRWMLSRYRRLLWDCGLDPFHRLLSRQKRIREEEQARRHKKVGRPTKWTVRQAATAINTWGISYGHFPERDEYRGNTELRPKKGWPVASSKSAFVKAVQKARLDDEAEVCDLPGAPIKITDSGVDLLSNRQ